MENQLLLFQNITVAVKAKNALEKAGIHGYVQKTPKYKNNPTCGYSVFVPQNTDKAYEILSKQGFAILGRMSRAGL